ncbi:MAG TPA: TonB-dependent receptor [Novimethylophilus sp.]|uniref:TonB-dependent receptor n=1 Tax=Novimethylophilus sp. TaxID=2137426 RepID=UPI002F412123
MSKPTKRRPQVVDSRFPSFKLRPIAATCSMLLIATASYAQEAAEAGTADAGDNMETVVVTGLRHSIESSVAAKHDSNSIIEMVTSEDIGKLPDVSIAENLARLPGLTAQRVDGRAQVISIRGMAPKYGVTLLNGREMVSTGDNRSVEYDQFPSELINSATVYKTPDASLSAMGLSGTVNLKSVRPLDFNERKVNLSVRGERNSNGELIDGSDAYGNRISASYIDQFADNTVGVALGYARLDNPGQEKYYKSWWWADTGKWGSQIPGLPAGTTALQGFEAGANSIDRVRNGLMGVFEFKPNKDFHSMVDLYYTRFDQDWMQSELQAEPNTWNGTTYTNPIFTQVSGNNVAAGGTIATNFARFLGRHNDRKDDVFAIGWNNEYKRDKWTFGADLGYSKAKRHEQNGELTALTTGPVTFNNATIATDVDRRPSFNPVQNLADPAFVFLTQQWGRGGRNTTTKVDDEMKTLRFSVKRDFDAFISSLEGGINYSDRSKDMKKTEVYYMLKGGVPVPISANLLKSPTSLGFVGVPKILTWDFNGVLNKYYDTTAPQALSDSPGRVWGVHEKVTTYYGKADIDIDARVPIRGNMGIQIVHADQQSTGLIWDGTKLTPMSGGKTRTDVLPSLNLIFDLGNIVKKGTIVRFGAAKEMARPNMEDMRAGFSGVSVSAPPFSRWSASGGNPTLDPWIAYAYDLSLEKYFGKRSYVGAAFFVKELQSFVFKQTIDYNFAGFPNPTTNTPASNIGDLTTQANGAGGFVHGQEYSAALDAGLINPSLDGVGFIGSLSHTTSTLHEANNVNNSLEGLSGIVRNLTFYYEKHGFSARISERFRSKFMATVRNQFGDNSFSAIESEKIVDLQLGYAFENGPYKGLSILFQVNNLTDEPYETSISSATNGKLMLPERNNTFGRQFLLGATYKF